MIYYNIIALATLSILIFCSQGQTIERATIKIGLTLSGVSTELDSEYRDGLSFAEEWIRENPIKLNFITNITIWPDTPLYDLDIRFEIREDMDKTTEVEQIYQSFMDDATISFIWAPIGLDTARRAAEVALENQWALFSYANRDPYINTFNRRLLPLSISEANLYKRVLAPLRVAGAHNVTIILSSEQIHSKDPGPMKCAHPLFLEAIELNFLKFNNSFLESTPRSPDESISSEWEEEMYPKLLDMMERDPDIWIFCDGDPAAENWYIRKMREAGYTPRAFVGLKQSMDDYDEDTIDYRSAIALFASDVDYPPDSFNTTMKDYNKDFYARFGRNMSEPSIDALIVLNSLNMHLSE